MKNIDHLRSVLLSRRGILSGGALLAGAGALVGVGLTATPAAAQTKITQALAKYQATPKGAARCDSCAQFQSPKLCKVVQGTVAPSGWCILYAPKSQT